VLCASGCGARIEAAHIPRRGGATLAQALHEGEDYELLAALPPGPLPPFAVRIGACVAAVGLADAVAVLVHADGREEPLAPGGYEHGA
jgi:thiamine monophosphate kinase